MKRFQTPLNIILGGIILAVALFGGMGAAKAVPATTRTPLITTALLSTSPGIVSQGATISLGTLGLSPYNAIRIYATNRSVSPTNVEIRLQMSVPASGQPLDDITLTPGKQITTAYPVPGATSMQVLVSGAGSGSAKDIFDLTIFASN